MINKFTIKEVEKFWDQVGEDYEKYHIKEDVRESHFQRFKIGIPYLSLKPGFKILNIWSRTGEAIPFLRESESNLDIYNLEVSNEFIKVAMKNFPNENFKKTDLENLPFQDNFFDAILSLETLEHTPKPPIFLKELHRVLRPNGQLVMSVPTSTMEWPMRIYQAFSFDHGEGPHKFLYPTTVKKFIKEAGFNLHLHRGTLLLPAGPKALRNIAERCIEICQHTPLKNFGLRQFYICTE